MDGHSPHHLPSRTRSVVRIRAIRWRERGGGGIGCAISRQPSYIRSTMWWTDPMASTQDITRST
jgi:hypothetical protein